MPDEVQFLHKGKQYAGWTEVKVTRAMDAIAGAFVIQLTERWAGNGRIPAQLTPWPILNGDPCEIRIDGETIINGYVDQFRPSFGPLSHSIEIQGRDKTCDLVDCSAFHQPDQWKNIGLLEVARILCAPFGVSVRADVDLGEKFSTVKIQQGETVFSALDRLARFRKVILSPDGAGGVVLTRAGQSRAATRLVQGVNILEADANLDTSQRYSLYVVKGQSVASLTLDGETETHAEARVTDTDVTRYRPLVVMAEGGADNASSHDRAVWEANVRLGRSAVARIKVRGWRQGPSGALWSPNLLVPVKSPYLRMDGDMLIRQVTYSRTPGAGTTCDLDLVSPQAFSPEPPDKEKAKRQATGGRNIWREALGDDNESSS